MHTSWFRAIAFAAVIPIIGAAQTSVAPANNVISAAKMRADLEFLSGDGFRGRLTDTPENALALEWMKTRFQWLGLKPMGTNGSYFLPYDLSLGSLAEGNDLTVTLDGTASHHAMGNGFYPHRYSPPATATGDVVFAHFGIRAPTLGYDDLGGDVRGKILLILDHEPGEMDSTSMFDGVVTSEFSNPLKKALAAQAVGQPEFLSSATCTIIKDSRISTRRCARTGPSDRLTSFHTRSRRGRTSSRFQSRRSPSLWRTVSFTARASPSSSWHVPRKARADPSPLRCQASASP